MRRTPDYVKAFLLYLLVLVLSIGAACGIALWNEPPQITTVVKYLPATDQQLAEWWFGKGNEANKIALKERICK